MIIEDDPNSSMSQYQAVHKEWWLNRRYPIVTNSDCYNLMASQLNPRPLFLYRNISRLASVIVLAGGFLVLIGWLFDISVLKSILPGFTTMKVNTALGFLLASISLVLYHTMRENKWVDLVAKGCAAFIVLIGLLTLSEYIFSQNFGIDQLIFQDALTPENPYPGRMSVVTALNFSLLGSSLLLLHYHRYWRLLEVLVITTLLISLFVLSGYIYGIPSPYHVFSYSSLAFHTVISLCILSIGILFARPEQGLMRLFSSDNAGGVLARRLVPAALILPFVLGWLLLTGQRLGLYDSTFRLVLYASSMVIAFTILILWNASLLQSADLIRQQAQAQLGQSKEREAAILYASLDAVITIDSQGRILEFNPAAQKIFGYDRAEVVGREMSQLIIPPSLREQHRKGLAKYLSTGVGPVLGKRLELTALRADGTEFPIELTITPIVGGEQPLFTGFVRDITERKQAEERIAYQAYLLENVNDAVIGSDKDSVIRFWNQGAERMFGWKSEEVLGRSGREILRSEILDTDREAVLKILSQNGRWKGLSLAYRKDGTQVMIEASTITLRDANHSITGYVSVQRDITERKRAEEALAASERRFRALVENSSMLINLINREGVLTYVSPSSADMVGFTPKEMVGRKVVEFLHPDEIDDKERPLPNMFRSPGSVVKSERRVRHKDGTWRWVEGYSTNLLDDQAVGALVFNYRDITDRKLAEEELSKNAARTQALADISGMLATVHLDYQAVLDTTARYTTELIGDACAIRLVSDDNQWLEVASLYHPDAKTLAFLREMLATNPLRADTGIGGQIIQTGRPMLIPVISPEQLKAIVPSTAWSILDHVNIHSMLVVPLRAQGGVIGTLTLTRDQPERPYTSTDEAFLQDLADRAALSIVNARLYAAMQELNNGLEQRVIKRTAQLQESEEKFSKAFLASPAAVSIASLPEGRYINVNEALAKLTGYSKEELLGHTSTELGLVDATAREKILEAIHTAGFAHNVEIQMHTKSHEVAEVLTSIEQMEFGGQPCLLSVNFDITDRKRAEFDLQKAKLELEATNKELEAFSYSVSHDLRAPLRSIDGYSQAVLEDYGELLPIEGRNFLEHVRNSAHRMAELIEDLLKLSHVTRAPIKSVPVDLSRLAENILAELQRTYPERTVRFRVAPNLNARGDPQLLQVALENLLGNAWKYTSKREQAEIEFGSKYEDNQTIYFVRDNGAGFDMTYADKLFGAFQRLHTVTEFPGTGIGLATVQRIIHRHGGRIWAESAVERGATFFFKLPVLAGAEPKTAPKEADSIIKRAKEII